jgi:predicted HNH restriction endonuclease
VQPGCIGRWKCPKKFKQEVEKELTGRGEDPELNLIALCTQCHTGIHR